MAILWEHAPKGQFKIKDFDVAVLLTFNKFLYSGWWDSLFTAYKEKGECESHPGEAGRVQGIQNQGAVPLHGLLGLPAVIEEHDIDGGGHHCQGPRYQQGKELQRAGHQALTNKEKEQQMASLR